MGEQMRTRFELSVKVAGGKQSKENLQGTDIERNGDDLILYIKGEGAIILVIETKQNNFCSRSTFRVTCA